MQQGRSGAAHPGWRHVRHSHRCDPEAVGMDAARAISNTHEWFEVNSGWAPPDEDELAEWLGDGVCRCPDDCLVEPDGWCLHGLASWWLILRAMDADA
jgi:hypothetical protein